MKSTSRIVFEKILLLGIALSFMLTGCRPSPESLKWEAVRQITAKNLFPLAMQDQIRAYAEIPGGIQIPEEKYNAFCKKYALPMDVPFEDLLKQGKCFDSLTTDVQSETLQRSPNSTTRDDTLFKVTFKAAKSHPNGNVISYLLVFVLYNSPEGWGIIQFGGTIEVNGKRHVINEWQVLLPVIADVAHGGKVIQQILTTENQKPNQEKEKKSK